MRKQNDGSRVRYLRQRGTNNPLVDRRLTGTALLISFAVGLAWVAVVFLFKRAFKALA